MIIGLQHQRSVEAELGCEPSVTAAASMSLLVAVYPDLSAAEASIYALLDIGLDPAKGSIVWRVGLSEVDGPGPNRLAERTTFWRTCGHLWSGRANLPVVGLMTTIPELGVILVGGHLATVLIIAEQFADGDTDTGGSVRSAWRSSAWASHAMTYRSAWRR